MESGKGINWHAVSAVGMILLTAALVIVTGIYTHLLNKENKIKLRPILSLDSSARQTGSIHFGRDTRTGQDTVTIRFRNSGDTMVYVEETSFFITKTPSLVKPITAPVSFDLAPGEISARTYGISNSPIFSGNKFEYTISIKYRQTELDKDVYTLFYKEEAQYEYDKERNIDTFSQLNTICQRNRIIPEKVVDPCANRK